MRPLSRATRTTWRLFVIYLIVTAVPVLALGLVLAEGFRNDARDRGLREGHAEAALLARTTVEPALGDRPLSRPLTTAEHTRLQQLVRRALAEHQILRLRLRDLHGDVVYADDGSGFHDPTDDEALNAARGGTVALLTRLDADAKGAAAAGTSAVEVYLPLSGPSGARIGVLEVYLPYAPIAGDLSAGLNALYRDLVIGLTALYFVLFVITASLSGRLRREAERNFHLARFDPLTELPNRALFHERLAEALEANAAVRRRVTVATVDIDRFKEVNDALGHANGDQVLIELAQRMAGRVRAGETVARLAGDEFGLILRGSEDPDERLRRLRALLEDEVTVAGLELNVEASFGYAIAPEDGVDVGQVLQRADVARNAAKTSHAGVLRYRPDLERFNAERLSLATELRHAIDDDQLVLHYQPQQNLATGRLQAVEALVRWQHASRGLLYPDAFLALAEQTDVIDALTWWVLHRALDDLQMIDPDGTLSIAVNISARNLASRDLPGQVLDALKHAAVSPHRLILEVTETAILADPTRAASVLGSLAKIGVRISLDDFGRGQTSLSYLSTLPLDELKIDRSFVADMLQRPAHAAIVRSMIDLGHNLGLHVVAEGIETVDVLSALTRAGCDLGQGYLIARPLTLDHLCLRLAHAADVPHPAVAVDPVPPPATPVPAPAVRS